jgi:hypothetical protein
MKRIVVRECWKTRTIYIVTVLNSCKGDISWPGDLAKTDVVEEENGRGGGGGIKAKKVQNGPEARMKWKH